MTRELVASAVLTADQFGLLALHRHVPEASLVDLLRRAEAIGDPIRLSLFHFQQCPRCAPAALVGDGLACERGRRLLAEAHGWRARPGPA